MKVVVDREKCQQHGQCTLSAPEVFRLEAIDKLIYVSEPDESLRSDIEDAADACPTQAITIID